jgi:hypothetical protein
LNSGARSFASLALRTSNSIMAVVNLVEMHEMPTDTSAAGLEWLLRTMAACNAAPGPASNAISSALPIIISDEKVERGTCDLLRAGSDADRIDAWLDE